MRERVAAKHKTFRDVATARLMSARYPLAVSGVIALGAALATGRVVLVAVLYAVVVAAAIVGPRASHAERYRARMNRLRAKERTRGPRAKALLDAMPDPVLVLSDKLVIERANEAARQAFGDLRGLQLGLRFRSPPLAALVERVRSGGPGEEASAEAFGTDRLYAVHAARAERENGHARIVLVFHERTAEQIEARVRAEFVANASHELRTPLASLIGFIETLQGPARGDEDARDRFLHIMEAQARRMARLIDDLMVLNRAERAIARRPNTSVDLSEVADMAVAAARPAFEAAGLPLELHVADGVHSVLGDADALNQVVSNLIENALRYGASGDRVRVEVGGDGAAVRLSVRDWGEGIEAEHIPRLTERFYRADTERSRSTGGTGLGLAIVKHILARHGTRLTVESEVGEGSTFSFSIPRHAS